MVTCVDLLVAGGTAGITSSAKATARKSSGRPVGCFTLVSPSCFVQDSSKFQLRDSAAARELTCAVLLSGPADALVSTGLAALGYKYVNIGAPTRDFQFTPPPIPSHLLFSFVGEHSGLTNYTCSSLALCQMTAGQSQSATRRYV
jgi:hypothetical protein